MMSYSCLFLLLATTINLVISYQGDTVPGGPQVAVGYTQWSDHSYKVYSEKSSWEEAEGSCEADGAHLVIVNSQEEANFVRSLISNAYRHSGLTYPGAWAGFRDTRGNGEWRTLLGRSLDETGYNRWWRNGDKTKKNHCGAIKTCGRFSAMPCDSVIAFVCELDNDRTPNAV